jgi:hypothetical protein
VAAVRGGAVAAALVAAAFGAALVVVVTERATQRIFSEASGNTGHDKKFWGLVKPGLTSGLLERTIFAHYLFYEIGTHLQASAGVALIKNNRVSFIFNSIHITSASSFLTFLIKKKIKGRATPVL